MGDDSSEDGDSVSNGGDPIGLFGGGEVIVGILWPSFAREYCGDTIRTAFFVLIDLGKSTGH